MNHSSSHYPVLLSSLPLPISEIIYVNSMTAETLPVLLLIYRLMDFGSWGPEIYWIGRGKKFSWYKFSIIETALVIHILWGRKKLTAVDNLDANVISKFPLRPSSAGTKMKTSVTFLNTSQCCKKKIYRIFGQSLKNIWEQRHF